MSTGERRDGLALAAAALLVLLHFLLRPWLLAWWAGPDLAVAALLVGALHLPSGRAAILGFVLGLLEAAMAMGGIGALPMAYAVVGYGASRSWGLLFADVRIFLPAYFFVGGWLCVSFHQWATTGDIAWSFLFLQGPAAALLTTAVAGLVEVAAGGLRG